MAIEHPIRVESMSYFLIDYLVYGAGIRTHDLQRMSLLP